MYPTKRIRIQKSATYVDPMPFSVRPRNDNNEVATGSVFPSSYSIIG